MPVRGRYGPGRLNFAGVFISLLIPFLFQCCAPVYVQPPSPPLDSPKITHIISDLREQEERVRTFFSSGRLIFEAKDSEHEANILIVGTKVPFRIKFEITHPWGRSLLHILIQDSKVHILSFPEKRYYVGHIEILGRSKFFPGRLDTDQIWAFARGYPILRKHGNAVSSKGNQITLFNNRGETVQVINVYPESLLPRQISFPKQAIELSFSAFENENHIQYSRKTKLDDPKTETTLALNTKQIVFNKIIPKSIFEIKMPPDFKMIPLQETGAR